MEIASDKQASDIVLLDLRPLSAFTDFFVICSAESSRQISAIASALDEGLLGEGLALHHQEGADDSGWVLMDFGDLIVHIFSPEVRRRYDLETAWARAPRLVRLQ